MSPITLPELLQLITDAWPIRFDRGRVCHIHRNALELPSGAKVHLRVLIQTLEPAPRKDEGHHGEP